MKTRTLLALLALFTLAAAGTLHAQVNQIGDCDYRSGPSPFDGSEWYQYSNDTGHTINITVYCSDNFGSGWPGNGGDPGVPTTGNVGPGQTFWLATYSYFDEGYSSYSVQRSFSYSIVSSPVTISWSTSTPTFNGSWQTGATASISPAGAATISGDSGLYAGTYTASASLVSSDYYWAAGQTTAVNWSIAKAHRNLNVSCQPSGYTNTGYTFTASPDAGGGTITWDGGGTGSFNSYSWNAAGYYTVFATISGDPNYVDASGSASISIGYPPTYSVTVNISPAAAASAGCSASASPSSGISYGQNSSLSASAASGWQFTGWTGDSPRYIHNDITVTANFSALPVSASISVRPSSDSAPGATTVSWSTSNATSVSVSGSGVGSSAANGSQYVAGLSPGSYTYTISASGPGGSASQSVTFTVAPSNPVTFTFSNLSQTYDGSTKTASVTCSDSSATYSTDLTKGPNAGSYTVSASAYGNYTGSGSNTLTILKGAQTINFSAVANKTYLDAPFTVSATATSGLPVTFSISSGPATISGSTITITGAGTVTVRGSQGGNANYNAAPNAGRSFTVAKAVQPALTLNFTTPQTYGSTQTLSTTGGGGTGAVSYLIMGYYGGGLATIVGANLTANSGVGYIVIQAYKLADANYLQASSAMKQVNFQPQPLTPGMTAVDKIYDGTTAATINGRSLAGVLGTDDVTLTSGTAVFASKTVGTGKTVTATGLSLTGAQASYYTLATTTAMTTANITAKTLTVTGVTAGNKVYDGSTVATLNLSGAVLNGVISGDTISLVTTGAVGVFSDKNIGTGKTVTISGLALAGADAGNYVLVPPPTTADITAKGAGNGLAVVGITANNKTYDGTTVASLHLGSATLLGVVSGDTVSLNTSGASGAFSDKNVGTGKTVTVSGLTLGGADAGNYSLTPLLTVTGNITPATPTITWAPPAAIAYGTPLSATQLNATASVPGTLTYTPAAGTVLNARTGQTLQVNFVPTDSVNYTTASATTTITVNKADQTVTLTPLASAVPLGTPIAYTAAGGATGVYVWGGTAGASGGGTTQTVTLTGALGNYTVTVYAPGNSNYNDSPPVTATITAQAQTLALSLTPLVSNYTVTDTSSPLNGKTYKRVWQDGGAWHAYLGRSGEQFQIVGQATTAVQAFELQALEPNADPSAWYSLATIPPPSGAPNGPGVGVTGVFSVSLDTASAAAALVPQSYAQGNPKTGVWQLRARTQDSSGTWSNWSNIVAVTVDLPLTTAAIPAQSLPPAGPIGGWFTASDQTTFNLPIWIP